MRESNKRNLYSTKCCVGSDHLWAPQRSKDWLQFNKLLSVCIASSPDWLITQQRGTPASICLVSLTYEQKECNLLLPPSTPKLPSPWFSVFTHCSKSLWSSEWTLHVQVGWPACICPPACEPHTESSLSVRALNILLHRARTGRQFSHDILTSYQPKENISQSFQTLWLSHWLSQVATSHWHCWAHSQPTAHSAHGVKKTKHCWRKGLPVPSPEGAHGKGGSPAAYNWVPNFHSYSSLSLSFSRGRSSLQGNPTAEVSMNGFNVLIVPDLI